MTVPNQSIPAPRPASARLARLERVLPLAILGAVVVYELVFEFLFADRIAAGARFFLEVLVFGCVGALVTWGTLEWLKEHIEREAEYGRMATQKERQLAAIISNSADAIFMLDNDGLIQTWNRGAQLIFGYTPDEVIGKHFQLLWPKELIANHEVERMNRELDERSFIRNLITHRITKEGKILTVELSRTGLHDEDGNVVGSAATLRDVTERERTQAQVRELNRHLESQVAQRTRELSEANERLRLRKRELEKANAELLQLDELKSEFVSLVSHELRAPLTNISGSLQLLLAEDKQNSLTPHQREILGLANEQTDHLARLVKGVLDVARIESGQMPLSPQAFDLVALLERNLAQWQVFDTAHIWIGPHASNLPSVRGDPDRVEQVLMNLFDNALKYSQAGAVICVGVQVVENRLVVSVTDQGEGIAAGELEKIFDKFHRIERGDARKTYGYGLGLYISRKFIEAMGGELWAESRVGQGSTFYFSLPLASQRNASLDVPLLKGDAANRPIPGIKAGQEK